MKPFLLTLARWLHGICLSIWIGGLLVIGAIVAPIAFRHAGLDTTQAGNVVGNSFLRFNVVLYAAGALLLLTELAEWGLNRSPSLKWRRLAWFRLTASVALVALTLYLGFSVAPEMFRDREAGNKADFAAAHQYYGTLAQVQVWLAAWIGLLSVMMNLQPRPSAQGSDVEREELIRR